MGHSKRNNKKLQHKYIEIDTHDAEFESFEYCLREGNLTISIRRSGHYVHIKSSVELDAALIQGIVLISRGQYAGMKPKEFLKKMFETLPNGTNAAK